MVDTKQVWVPDTQLTITLASLAEDANLLTGRESTAFALDGVPSGLIVDAFISGKITTGTTPTVGEIIEIWAFGPIEDTPTYPDVMDGTDSAETITNEQVKQSGFVLVHSITVTADSNITYPFGPFGVANLFGGKIPTDIGVFVTHSTDVNLNSTAGNHEITITPVYFNSA